MVSQVIYHTLTEPHKTVLMITSYQTIAVTALMPPAYVGSLALRHRLL